MRSLYARLIVGFLIVSLVGIVLAGLYIWQATTTEFAIYVVAQSQTSIADRLSTAYREAGSWAGVDEQAALGGLSANPNPPVDGVPREPRPFVPQGHIIVANLERAIVIPGRGYESGQVVSEAEYAQGTSIEVDGTEVGRLLLGYEPSRTAGPFERFMGRFYLALGLGGLGGTTIALLLGMAVARRMTSPVRDLTRAARAVSRGDLQQQIEVRGDDELGDLARAFNQMSTELVRSQAQRRQMTADISHELRTPLSLILGHTEALADGVLEPAQESFDVLYDEARHLTRLVDDLHTLSLSEAGELSLECEPTAPEDLVQSAVAAHTASAEAKGIRLQAEVALPLPEVDVDPDRIMQVLNNLLSNAQRYTPSGGQIVVSARQVGSAVQFRVQDTGPGLSEEDRTLVFERLHRGDKARQRSDGGSGLGLSIAKSLVERHGGRMWAESAPGQGATFIFELPASAGQ